MNFDTCFYVPGSASIVDVVRPSDGLSLCYGHTLAEVQARYPSAVLMAFDEAVKLCEATQRARYCTGPVEITREQFDEWLNVLPPSKWTRGGHEETFHVVERITGSLVQWCARLGDRYFAIVEDAGLGHHEIVKLVHGG